MSNEAEIHLDESEVLDEEEIRKSEEKLKKQEENENEQQGEEVEDQSQSPLNESPKDDQEKGKEKEKEKVKEANNQRRPSKVEVFSQTLSEAITNINPLALKVNKGIHQVIQFAGEKIGAVNKTVLPVEYTLLEGRVDKLKAVYETLINLSAYQIHQQSSTLRMDDVKTNFSDKIVPEAEKVREVDLHQLKGNRVAVSEYLKAGKMVGQETNFGTALIKTGELHDRLSKHRYQMYQEINEKTIRKLGKTLDTRFKHITNLRRLVGYSRLKLDSIKSIARSATTSQVEEIGDEITEAQDQFQKCVNDAVYAMREILKSNDASECLANYHSAMLNYFKHASEKMAELLPEIDSLKVAEEGHSKLFLELQKEEELKEKEEREARETRARIEREERAAKDIAEQALNEKEKELREKEAEEIRKREIEEEEQKKKDQKQTQEEEKKEEEEDNLGNEEDEDI